MTRPALIVLAAGASRRFGSEDKLLADLDGAPLLTRTLRSYSRSRFSKRILVVKAADGPVADMGRSQGFEIVVNTRAASGMGASIAAGVRGCSEARGVLIALGDMPFIAPETIDKLLDVFLDLPEAAIAAPSYKARRGHPAIFGAVYFKDLTGLDGDVGAKGLIERYGAQLRLVPVEDAGVLEDVDKIDDLVRLRGGSD